MPNAPDIALPDRFVLARCDMWLDNPGRLGDRIGTYGHFRPHVARGALYWRAEIEIHPLLPGRYDDALYIESVIGRLQKGATLRVPVWRRDKWRRPYRYVDATGSSVALSGSEAGMTVLASGKRFSVLSGGRRVVLKPGAMFTVDHQLYQYQGTADLNTNAADIANTEPTFAGRSGAAVEILDPYFVGMLREGVSTRLARETYAYGPWDLELVEIAR